MVQYRYRAITQEGKPVDGVIDAASVKAVVDFLNRDGLKPLSVHPLISSKMRGVFLATESVKLIDKIFLFKYLALMLKVGTDIYKAIDILIHDFQKPSLKRFLYEVKSNLEKGSPLYVSFQNHPRMFSQVVVNTIRAAETSGNLEQALDDLSGDMEKEHALISKVRSSLAYPIILIVASVILVFVLATFIFPKIYSVFIEAGVTLPVYSRVVLGTGLFLAKWFWIIFSLVVFLILFFWFYFKFFPSGRKLRSRILERAPLIGALNQKIALERFSAILSRLLKSGLTIIEGLEISAQAVTNEGFRLALLRIKDRIIKGMQMGESFAKESDVFPQVALNLIAVGEQAGQLENILATLADFYEKEIDASLKTLVAFIEPALILTMGVIVGLMAVSLIVPIYQLVTAF